jgi:hypothetical protein
MGKRSNIIDMGDALPTLSSIQRPSFKIADDVKPKKVKNENVVSVGVGDFDAFMSQYEIEDGLDIVDLLADSQTMKKIPDLVVKNSKKNEASLFDTDSILWVLKNFQKGDVINVFLSNTDIMKENLLDQLKNGIDDDIADLMEEFVDMDEEDSDDIMSDLLMNLPDYLYIGAYIERDNEFYSHLGHSKVEDDLMDKFNILDLDTYDIIRCHDEVEFLTVLASIEMISPSQISKYVNEFYSRK